MRFSLIQIGPVYEIEPQERYSIPCIFRGQKFYEYRTENTLRNFSEQDIQHSIPKIKKRIHHVFGAIHFIQNTNKQQSIYYPGSMKTKSKLFKVRHSVKRIGI